MNQPVCELNAWRIDNDAVVRAYDQVAEEMPVALVYNGVSHAVMMATPTDLDDFARGFSLSEGIVRSAEELDIVETRSTLQGVSIQMLIPSARFEALRERGRQLTGRVGCGLCGAESLAAAIRPLSRVDPGGPVPITMVREGLEQLSRSQPWNDRCHGLHAAGFVSGAPGAEFISREDVGRHNALDKLIGALAFRNVDPRSGFLAITSRASHEIVHKAASVGVGLIAAISAPTALAVQLAEEAGITLIAFARGRTMTIYAHPERIALVGACVPAG